MTDDGKRAHTEPETSSWTGRNRRLDPSRLPEMVSYTTRDNYGDVTFTLNQRGVVVRRTQDSSSVPAIIALPAKTFRGVAACAMEDPDEKFTAELKLLHNDPMLTVPLLVSDDLELVAADWRAWAEAYRLPMLLLGADGIARTLEETLGSNVNALSPQRPKHRPRLDQAPRLSKVGLMNKLTSLERIGRLVDRK
ncbi:DUF6101 family protein [Mesorhizobium sp. B2-3-13]|uniref:DUF6101 family protein n=1 Tax=Mesorhizobium sp. B2-3-13 TaxID=2589951 RepID=UPI001FEE3D49|nr:DUF6101 family protein [Mesorhizobium sp. B2-3-13]